MKTIHVLLLLGLSWPAALDAQVCSSPSTTIYGMTSSAGIYPIALSNASTGAKINPAYSAPAPNQANAIGYNDVNGKFYYFKINPGLGAGQEFFSYDPTANTYATLATSPITVSVHSGGVTVDGSAYYCFDINGKLYYYNIALNTWTTITGNIVDQSNNNVSTVISNQNAGDMAVDGSGNLWFLTSSAGNYGLYEISAPLPTTATATVTVKKVIDPSTATPGGSSFMGVAFNSSGSLYLSTATGDDKLYVLNSNLTTSYIGKFTVSGVGNDMTSCSFPMTVLPVIWHSFATQLQNNGEVSLHWTVSAQPNDKGYGVEYSEDGVSWHDLAFIDAAGNDQQQTSYAYIQQNPASGKNYYRIREEDFNGQTSYSGIETVEIRSGVTVSCWPNPVKDLLNIGTTGNGLQGASVRIFDRSGNLILQRVWSEETGAINIGSLPAGLYVVHIQSLQGQTYNSKLLKQ